MKLHHQGANRGASRTPGRLPEGPRPEQVEDAAALQQRVADYTRTLLAEAGSWLRLRVPDTQIRFDLRGRAAGQARCGARSPWVIRYNPVLLGANGERFLADTVPHEVAHLIAFAHHGPRIRPHGLEWRAIMHHFGVAPERCHQYDLSGLPVRSLRVFEYHCDCNGHRLSSIRHNRVLAGGHYVCRRCATTLRPGPRADPERS